MPAKGSVSKSKVKEEPKEQPKPVIGKDPRKILFKADSRANIDGFLFNPYLLVDKDDTIRRKDGDVKIVDFLRKSAWYGRKFWEIKGPDDEALKAEKRDIGFCSKDELIKLAREFEVPFDPKWSIEELYVKVFGGESRVS